MVLCRWEDLPENMRCQAVRPYYEALAARQGMLLLKFIFDRIMALLLLVLLSPVFLLVAAWIRLDSPGEVFFRQERVTRYGRRFRIYKFRTMVKNAESLGTQVTTQQDMRVTNVGRKIRACRLDEIPQLINILKGEMSLVGPRPALWNQDDLVAERDKYGANDVLPGLTGWAQINGYRGDTSIRRRIDYDIYYIENWTMGFDFKIMFLTIFRGFMNENAY